MQTLKCFGGEKLDRGAENATVEQVTPAAHQQLQLYSETWKSHSLRRSLSKPGLKLQKGTDPLLPKGQRLEITFSSKIKPGIQFYHCCGTLVGLFLLVKRQPVGDERG